MSGSAPIIAVLYPGEMGVALAAVLRARGMRVITTLAARGPETAGRCREVSIEIVPTLAELVRLSDVVISVVLPAAADEVAMAYCQLAHLAPTSALYVDANSIGPEQASVIAERLHNAGRDFVDAAVNGLAANLTRSGTLFLSGGRAAQVAALFQPTVHVRVLGAEPGRASAMKMLLGGLSKGLCGLYAELALLAERRGMLGEMIEESTRIYPGLMLVVDRMLPTYMQHAGRRATEMNEVEQTARATGMQPCVIEAVRRLHEELAALGPAGACGCDGANDGGQDGGHDRGRDVASFIRHLAGQDVLGGGGLVPYGEERSEL